jgi:tetratricopeptide (TPR) repeat protein
MLQANYYTHDRSNNWVPWDYSYNLLQSCAPNAVLFTNGDNDTFPLWYLQDVEGVRRDVKIVNLSLLNTDWYIDQLKNSDPYKVGTVRIRLTEQQIKDVRPIEWTARKVSIPLPKPTGSETFSDMIQQYNLRDTSLFKQGDISWTMNPTLTYGNIKAIRVQDLLVREIVEANNWQRPIYFAVTCSEDSKIGLSDYLRMEGMAFRLVPEKRGSNDEFIEPTILKKNLTEVVGYSKNYQPGFKFRGLNDPKVFLDDNQQRMVQNYRNAFLRLTIYYLSSNQKDQAIKTLDQMEEKLPNALIPMDYGLLYEISTLYQRAGAQDKYLKLAKEVERLAKTQMEKNPNDVQSYYNPYRILLEIYQDQGRNDKLLEIWQKLESIFPDDPNVKANVERYKALVEGKDTSSTSIGR